MTQILNLQLTPTPELLDSFRLIVREELKNSLPATPDLPDYLTRRETADLLRISLVTLNEWSKQGILQSQRINGRIRYKRAIVENALQNVMNLKYKPKK